MLLEEFALTVTIEVPKSFWNVLAKGGCSISDNTSWFFQLEFK